MDNGKSIRESRDLDIPIVARHFYHHAGTAHVHTHMLAGTAHVYRVSWVRVPPEAAHFF